MLKLLLPLLGLPVYASACLLEGIEHCSSSHGDAVCWRVFRMPARGGSTSAAQLPSQHKMWGRSVAAIVPQCCQAGLVGWSGCYGTACLRVRRRAAPWRSGPP